MEKELTDSVDLCTPKGRLNPSAVGWSRFPRHNTNLRGMPGRNKRFDYWCVCSEELIVAFSLSDIDYRSGASVFFLDRRREEPINLERSHWLRRNPSMRSPWGSGPLETIDDQPYVLVDPREQGIDLRIRSSRVNADIEVDVPEGHESMGVVVPWSQRTFQYTRKDNCLPARGKVLADGVEYVLGADAMATMDHGRGRWPYNTVWNWASAGGHTDGHEIGLQFGGKWTEGTPSTENALRIDGRMEKISEELDWSYDNTDWMAPWTITGDRVDVTFHPEYHRSSKMDRVLLLSREDQVFGSFSGRIVSDAGRTYQVRELFGWAEEVHRRW